MKHEAVRTASRRVIPIRQQTRVILDIRHFLAIHLRQHLFVGIYRGFTDIFLVQMAQFFERLAPPRHMYFTPQCRQVLLHRSVKAKLLRIPGLFTMLDRHQMQSRQAGRDSQLPPEIQDIIDIRNPARIKNQE